MGYGLGVDLGTSFTGIVVSRYGETRIVLLSDDPDLQASLQRVPPAGSPLRETDDTVPILLGGRPYPAVPVLAGTLHAVLESVQRSEGAAPDKVVLTCPAVWGPPRRQQFAEVSRQAGLNGATMVSEPEAAVASLVGSQRLREGDLVIVYDIGGVTADITVVRVGGGGPEILGLPEAVQGAAGADFDDLVLAYVDRTVGGSLSLLDLGDPIDVGLMVGARAESVRAKESLSRTRTATIRVMGGTGLITPVHLTRSQFEDMIRPSLISTLVALNRVLESAGVTPPDLAGVVLVGGSARIPLVARTLAEELARPMLTDDLPQHSVACGAALIAHGGTTLEGGTVGGPAGQGGPAVADPWSRPETPTGPLAQGPRPGQMMAAGLMPSLGPATASIGLALSTLAEGGPVLTEPRPAGPRSFAGPGDSTASDRPDPFTPAARQPRAEFSLGADPGEGALPLARRAGGHRRPSQEDWRRRVGRHEGDAHRLHVLAVVALAVFVLVGGASTFVPRVNEAMSGMVAAALPLVADPITRASPGPTSAVRPPVGAGKVPSATSGGGRPVPGTTGTAAPAVSPSRPSAPGAPGVSRGLNPSATNSGVAPPPPRKQPGNRGGAKPTPTAGGTAPAPAQPPVVVNPVTGNAPLIGIDNKCLDLAGGSDAPGTAVLISTCTRGVSQFWSASGDQTLQNRGRCVQISAPGSAASRLTLQPCDNGSDQKWLVGSGLVVDATGGRCLDVSNGRSADGTPAVLVTCSNTRSQKWVFNR